MTCDDLEVNDKTRQDIYYWVASVGNAQAPMSKKKKKWRTEHLEGLRVPSTLQLGQLLRGGDGSRFGTNLLRGVIGPISTGNDYLNRQYSII